MYLRLIMLTTKLGCSQLKNTCSSFEKLNLSLPEVNCKSEFLDFKPEQIYFCIQLNWKLE